MFRLSEIPIDPQACVEAMADERAGALVAFEGWVRNHNDGRPVSALEYEAFDSMAVAEGNKLLERAQKRFAILNAHVVHRVGPTEIGDRAVWVGVTAEHRQEAFLGVVSGSIQTNLLWLLAVIRP
jgi:molybdopterin synthase catalytic subunit